MPDAVTSAAASTAAAAAVATASHPGDTAAATVSH